MLEKGATFALRAATIMVAVALVATLVWSLGTLGVRPLDGVEGEALFEAARLRDGLPLYVDPARGAYDYGPVPSRYFVLYPPIWSWLLSHVPFASAAVVGRSLASASWFGLLAWIAVRAPPSRRHVALVSSAFVGAVFTLALYGASARPDAIAVCLSGAALWRSVRNGHVDALSGALFALAAWTKPNVIGLGAGAMLLSLVFLARALRLRARGIERARATLPFIGFAAMGAGIFAILHWQSHGVWLQHLLRSTAQPLSFPLWWDQVSSRTQFLGLPLAFAAWCGVRGRADPGTRLALWALAASTAWALFSLAKIGSATNYWMEPCIGALVLVAHTPLPQQAAGVRSWLALAAAIQSPWMAVASLKSSWEAVPLAHARRAVLRDSRATCHASPAAVVVADEPGLELDLNGRLVSTPFQLTHLARRDLFSEDSWAFDMQRPEVVCLIMQDDLLERPATSVSYEHDRFGPVLRSVLARKFVLTHERAGLYVYATRLQVPPL